ncbi:hypothetical protein [Rhizobium sp. P40RR-XXII]|uniref:hypothetical protein n=1 Tax=Rhizobium sp. P40RR-XXII TaxID=2726739 RepID=UPI001FEE84F6|nr:hypothetical protein [Rhizobium sp. P40RR-XXII]
MVGYELPFAPAAQRHNLKAAIGPSSLTKAQETINQGNSKLTVLDSWSFGGGTVLMLQICHRESFDVDIFIDDQQVLPYLNPQTPGFALDLHPDAYTSDGAHALKTCSRISERSTLSSQRT